MYFKDVAYTLKKTTSLNELYRPVVSYTKQLIYCNVASVSQTEFYQSATAGFKPEIKIKTRKFDLNDVDHIILNDKAYKIIRIYEKEDFIELTLSSTIIDNSIGNG